MKEYRPIVHIPHSMKWPHLERNVFIAVMALLFIVTAIAVYKVESREQERARIQHMQEHQALQNNHAIDARP